MGKNLGNFAECLLRSRYEFAERFPRVGIDKLKMQELFGNYTRMPEILWTSSDEISLRDWLNSAAPRNFVLKRNYGCSSKQVFCFSRYDNRYYDSIRTRWYSSNEIQKIGEMRADGQIWFVQEFIGSPPIIPFDYKAYVADGEMKMMEVLDRNPRPKNYLFLDASWNRIQPEHLFEGYQFFPEILPGARKVAVREESLNIVKRQSECLAREFKIKFGRFDFVGYQESVFFDELTLVCGVLLTETLLEPFLTMLTPAGYDKDGNEWINKHKNLLFERALREMNSIEPDSYRKFLAKYDILSSEIPFEYFLENSPANLS